MKFKKLEIQPEGGWIKRTLSSKHFKQTIAISFLAMLIAYAIFYFGQDANVKVFWSDKALENVFIGLGIGIFITNSPCARGRC